MRFSPYASMLEHHAQTAAVQVETTGSPVTLSGGTIVTAVVDENPESVARAIPQDIYDSITGRPGLFYFSAADAALIPKGKPITYDGQLWDLHPYRPVAAGGSKVLVVILATAGATA